MADSDRTPLLQADHGSELGLPPPAAFSQVRDHPAFLRAVHSPWRWLPQNALCYLRGALLAYLVAVGIMILDYKVESDSGYSAWRIVFQYEMITYGLVLSYHAIVFAWTFTHLYFPYIEDFRTGWEYRVLRAMSLPQNIASLRSQFYFTLFYFVTSVFNIVNTILYWFLTLPHSDSGDGEPPSPQRSGLGGTGSPIRGQELELQQTMMRHDRDGAGREPFTDVFGEGWFRAFVYLNLFAVSTGIVIGETFFLNSIKRPIAVGAHVFGLLFLSGLYIGWASVGKVVTGADSFYWLDKDQVGSREAVVANCIGFIALSPIAFALPYGCIAIREALYEPARRNRANVSASGSPRVRGD